jgi:hypothetical protein
MENVQKNSVNSVQHTPSSESFQVYTIPLLMRRQILLRAFKWSFVNINARIHHNERQFTRDISSLKPKGAIQLPDICW